VKERLSKCNCLITNGFSGKCVHYIGTAFKPNLSAIALTEC